MYLKTSNTNAQSDCTRYFSPQCKEKIPDKKSYENSFLPFSFISASRNESMGNVNNCLKWKRAQLHRYTTSCAKILETERKIWRKHFCQSGTSLRHLRWSIQQHPGCSICKLAQLGTPRYIIFVWPRWTGVCIVKFYLADDRNNYLKWLLFCLLAMLFVWFNTLNMTNFHKLEWFNAGFSSMKPNTTFTWKFLGIWESRKKTSKSAKKYYKKSKMATKFSSNSYISIVNFHIY